jgi:ankyrin repeat protein
VEAQKGQIEILRVIGRERPELLTQFDQFNRSLLHLAAASGFVQGIGLLKSVRQLDPNAVDVFGLAPIHHAVAHDWQEAVAALLTFPGIVKTAADLDGNLAIHLAARLGATRALAALISPRPDENSPLNSERSTPLIVAVENGQREAALELMRAGASASETDGDGLPVMLHIRGSCARQIKKILERNWHFTEASEITSPYVLNGVPYTGKDKHGHRPRAGSCNVA